MTDALEELQAWMAETCNKAMQARGVVVIDYKHGPNGAAEITAWATERADAIRLAAYGVRDEPVTP